MSRMIEVREVLKRVRERFNMNLVMEDGYDKAVHPKVNPNVLNFGWKIVGSGVKKHIKLYLFTRYWDGNEPADAATDCSVSLYDLSDAELFETAYRLMRIIQAGPGRQCPYV